MEKDPCPLCGALPCDWTDDPHKAEVGLCWTLAKIRQVIGVNEKPMLDELPQIIATTITALQAEVAALREALEPFATALDDWGDEPEQPDNWNAWEHPLAMNVSVGDFRKARAALGQQP